MSSQPPCSATLMKMAAIRESYGRFLFFIMTITVLLKGDITMLAKVLNLLFGRWVHVTPKDEYSQQKEQIGFLENFVETLVKLEERLHVSDDADEIIKETFKTACEFYDADLAGFLEVNLEA